jgi:hypothetical protein
MPATFPASQAEDWADAVTLRPGGDQDDELAGVPRFALLETRGPAPQALLLSTLILTSLVFLSIVVGRIPGVSRAPQAETVTLLVALPEPRSLPDISWMKNSRESSTHSLQAPEPVAAKAPKEEITRPPSAPHKTEEPTPDLAAAKPIPSELIEKPAPILIQPERIVASTIPPAPPAAAETPKPSPRPVPPVSGHDDDVKPAAASPDLPSAASADFHKAGPNSLGDLSLSQLIADQAVLAAGLAALPSAERLSLPRVSIRVNAEWLAALPKTQERLYFSITAPEADREVLAYIPETRSFNLERPERPLWQIHDGERVPALAELRAAAGRWLGVSPALVGLYTWHPPVLENALQMFVLERMQELHVHLGPRDIVTVRLASGSAGAVMNLEPIRQDASP